MGEAACVVCVKREVIYSYVCSCRKLLMTLREIISMWMASLGTIGPEVGHADRHTDIARTYTRSARSHIRSGFDPLCPT